MDKFLRTNGINLHYLDHPGGEPALILLPGLTANAHVFDGLIAAGLNPRHRVLALDLRGRGLSDKPAQGYTMADHVADVLGLMDALNIELVVLVGHSFGALLTIYMGSQYPERVSRMVLIDVSQAATHPRTADLIKPSLDRLGRISPSWEVYKQEMQKMPYLDGFWDDSVEAYFRADMQSNDDGTVQARARPGLIAQAFDAVIKEPWGDHIGAAGQPAILINAPGPYGPPGAPVLVTAGDAQATAAGFPNCRYAQVPGNHVTMVFGDNAPVVVDVITEFLSGM
jgi:pimeloyl-ACP methyl ester carboxylesterase